jgi:SAM-dependent methyltransferase
MEIPSSKPISQIQQLLQKPRGFIEGEFSAYFYRYFARYSNPKKFDGYLALSKYLFELTKAKNACVLDLGCGFGLMATIFGLFGSREVVGYDLNDEKIEGFKKLLSHLNSEIQNVKPVLGDSSKIEYPNEYFDVVISNEAFSHIREPEESIAEVHRVLKPGGSFLIRDGNNSLFLPGRITRRRFWRRIERGPVDPSWFRSIDIPLPYLTIRQKMIRDGFQQMDQSKIDFLSRATAGMFGEEIVKAVEDFENKGKIPSKSIFPYRNPITGEYPEKEINPFTLKHILQKKGFEVSFASYFYSSSLSNIEMTIKCLSYWIEKCIPIIHLLLAPGFALLGKKTVIFKIRRKQELSVIGQKAVGASFFEYQ